MRIIYLFLLLLKTSIVLSTLDPCTHFVYCKGGVNSLLHVVQISGIYNDSKTFVDQPLKISPELIQKNFKELMLKFDNSPDKESVRVFVNENFEPEGTELSQWNPEDWNENPSFLQNIKDEKYRAFGKILHDKWKDLGRKIKKEVAMSPEKYSEIYMKHPFIVPGGRFREMYYWDSYWTIIGLLISEMSETVKGMLLNFVEMIEKYGYILNGNRVYYMNRSQPPLFISMVEEYVKATQDESFVRTHIESLEKEFQFWIQNRMVSVVSKTGKSIELARYFVNVGTPRPESYVPDYNLASSYFPSEKEKRAFYINIRSGAESGWDFSSKWFIKNSSNVGDLSDTQTTQILPVELNAYLCKNARILSGFFELLGNEDKASKYNEFYESFKSGIHEVFWNETSGSWFDYDLQNKALRPYFYPSNLTPLWANCFDEKKTIMKLLSYLKNEPSFKHPGGVPSSNIKTGQQWDLTNAWAPLQEILITGLRHLHHPEADEIAKDLARKWLHNNWLSFLRNNESMFEKYDVERVGEAGRGGEYGVQQGFGWTNGVALQLLHQYGQDLSSSTPSLLSLSFIALFIIHAILFFL